MTQIVSQQEQVTSEQLHALEDAFEVFGRQTALLKDAYVELQQRAERIDVELEQANRTLQQKVQELDETNNFLRSILESIPIAVVVTDLDGVVNTFNPAAEKMWGMPAEEALARSHRHAMGPHSDLLEGVLSGQYRRESVRRELGDQETRIITSTACLVEDSAGRPIGAIQLDRDMSRLCRLELALNQHQKLADLGKIATGLAHEVRKPLNGIKGFATLLAHNRSEGEKEHKYVGHIVEAVDRLNGMLGRLLDFARPNDLDLKPCDALAEAERIAEFIRVEGLPEGCRIRVRVSDDARWVTGDRDKIRQILLNLVKNAVEALEGPGEVLISAAPETQDGHAHVRISVTDTGKGIPEKELEMVLEPFYTQKDGGTGLGLAVVDRLLRLHGARLQIESRVGVGTTTSFLLATAFTPEGR